MGHIVDVENIYGRKNMKEHHQNHQFVAFCGIYDIDYFFSRIFESSLPSK